ncbi:MAG TPA: FAD-dependent oxidoreductase [Candidatus Absconditabacterales bacterium]|nr:FAD-dependent oxidoreductase [Candidatus Absconditabacterales bacterium]
MENLVIIGSGPAAHTAAIYAARANLNPLMFEGFMAGGVAAGGQLTTTSIVENFPGFPQGVDGTQLMMSMRKQSIMMGTRIETKTIDKVDFSSQPLKLFSGNEVIETKSVIIATGATAKRLGITGEKEYRQKGISACAVCDGGLPIFRNKPVVVIGGGDVAMEEAQHMSHFASKVIVLVRTDKLRASEVMQTRAKANEKIEFMRYTEALEALGNGDMLTGIKVINNQTKQETIVECSGLFYAIGHTPNTQFLGGQINLDDNGYIITYGRLCDDVVAGRTTLTPEQEQKFKDGKQRYQTCTSVSNVFAAGDVADKKYRQAITSAGTGCAAALEAQQSLQEQK